MAFDDTPKGGAPDFIYTIYIASDIETVWNGLIDREVTKEYWGHQNVSDWKSGSKWEHRRVSDTTVVDIHGKVLEIDPPRKLVVSWNAPNSHSFAEPAPSVVTYDLTALGPDTKLTVTHSKLSKNSDMQKGVTEGWPAVLSNLKTYLETGKVLSEEEWK